MKPYLIILVGLLSLASCQQEEKTMVSNPEDYNQYLASNAISANSKYFDLWNSKITADSTQLTSFGHVASEYHRYFQATGKIEYLKKAEQALRKAVAIAAIGKADYYRALARNYISQHRFREALDLAKLARDLGSGVTESQYLLFDLNMELGHFTTAEKYLDSLKNFSDFGYLIRIAKWNDHLGNLDTTIQFMEQAARKAEVANNRQLMLWSYTNLADYYGHAGRIADSYSHYLKSLAIDPSNAYAKKGIAWIVFSHEKKAEEAMRILDSVTTNYESPDYFLLKAEIADFMDDDLKRLFNLDQYFKAVKNPAYGHMYNAQNVHLFLEETIQFDRALVLAQKEVEMRPTPNSYDLLAYSYYKIGKLDKAVAIVESEIIGKTHEPALLLHAAEILKASGRNKESEALKPELLGAIYELGPSSEDRIRSL